MTTFDEQRRSGDDVPVDRHVAPVDVEEATLAGLGAFSEALETTERARGHLYTFHQLTGHADLLLDQAVARLAEAGHTELAEAVRSELIGRNVLPGRWSFQVVEEYDEGYYQCFYDLEQLARHQLVRGRKHLYEARMKEQRRNHVHPEHRAEP
jgi:hypothetical protein